MNGRKVVALLVVVGLATASAGPAPAAEPAAVEQAADAQTQGRTLALPEREPAPGEATDAAGSILFIGTATVLIRYGGFTILTDPNFLHKGEHAHLGYGLSSERLTEPALAFDELPPIDFVLLSHYHGDHFDSRVEEQLDKATPIISTRDAREALRDKGFSAVTALGKWETLTLTKGDARLRITSMPARHGPPVVHHALPETMGSMLEFPEAAGRAPYTLYITGDTLVFDEIAQIAQRHPRIDLALLHLGGTRVAGILVTMDARQGIEMLRIVQPDLAIPIHYDDYTVFKSPLADFMQAVLDAGFENRIDYLKHGDTYRFEPKASAH